MEGSLKVFVNVIDDYDVNNCKDLQVQGNIINTMIFSCYSENFSPLL